VTATRDSRAFLGVGWAFPPAVGQTGELAMARYDEDVAQAIRIVLGTTPGERVMRPTFGAGLRSLVFEPLNTTTMALAKHHVEVALATWEPRIDIKNVSVDAAALDNRMDIAIDYVVRATNTFYNLVYPFYLIEGDGS
jgi:phage baseplate assembly protein W